MDTEISDEELRTFLKEAGVPEWGDEAAQPREKILEEILSALPPAPEEVTDPSSTKKRVVSSKIFLPLLATLIFLAGVLFGSFLGFYVGKIQKLETIYTKISVLAEQVEAIYGKMTPDSPAQEIIDPIKSQNDPIR